ncbi:MAG: hydroxymethylbilane synthase [Pseudomonadota bacterium]|jgi:hydroxymethylbilane synthase
MRRSIIIGTRKSALALWQSEYIKSRLLEHFPNLKIELKRIVTRGDQTQDAQLALPEIGGKGLFTAELEQALLADEIDLAVHSLKDLPTVLGAEFTLGAIPQREVVEDVLISRDGHALNNLPIGSVVGTSSLRRSSQLLRLRPDLKMEHIRGNVDTRIRKTLAPDGSYDATILARAGLVRLGLEAQATEVVSIENILPAPGQGALGVECRSGDAELLEMLQVLHHPETAHAVSAERTFLAALGAGCNTPVAAYAKVLGSGAEQQVAFRGRCLATDGSRVIEVRGEASVAHAAELGAAMAARALSDGFAELRR